VPNQILDTWRPNLKGATSQFSAWPEACEGVSVFRDKEKKTWPHHCSLPTVSCVRWWVQSEKHENLPKSHRSNRSCTRYLVIDSEMKVKKHSLRRHMKFFRVGDIFNQRCWKTAGKWQKCKFYFGLHLAAWASHELGGLAPHQCRYTGVIWGALWWWCDELLLVVVVLRLSVVPRDEDCLRSRAAPLHNSEEAMRSQRDFFAVCSKNWGKVNSQKVIFLDILETGFKKPPFSARTGAG